MSAFLRPWIRQRQMTRGSRRSVPDARKLLFGLVNEMTNPKALPDSAVFAMSHWLKISIALLENSAVEAGNLTTLALAPLANELEPQLLPALCAALSGFYSKAFAPPMEAGHG